MVNRVLLWLARRTAGVEPMNLPQRAYLELRRLDGLPLGLWGGRHLRRLPGGVPTLDPGPPPVVAGAYMVAWGWPSGPDSSAGIGVFEVTLAALLGAADLGAGSIIVAGYRLVTLVRDLIATGIGEIRPQRPGSSKVEPEGPI